MKSTIIVFRHAESVDNTRDLFSGWRDSDLTSKGVLHANRIAHQLRSYRIDYAYTSHLKRAKKTLTITLKEHPPIPVFIDDRLIERCYGLLQGTSKAKAKKKNPEWFAKIHKGYDLTPPEGESLKMVEARILSFLEQLTIWLKQNPGNVAISCHSRSILPIIRFFEHLSIEEMFEREVPRDAVLIYKLTFDLDSKKAKKKTTKPHWNGVVIPHKVKLATDSLNVLRAYYNKKAY